MFIKAYKIQGVTGADKPYVMLSWTKFRVDAIIRKYPDLEDIFKGGPYIIGVDGSGASTGGFLFGLNAEKTEKVPLYALKVDRCTSACYE